MYYLLKISYILFVIVSLLMVTSCCKCQYINPENTKIIFVENYSINDFSTSRIVYRQDTLPIDTIYLSLDTTYYAGGFKLKSEDPLKFNYNWELQANDSLSFHFSKFMFNTSSEKSCCGKTTYLESYYLDNIKQTESYLFVK